MRGLDCGMAHSAGVGVGGGDGVCAGARRFVTFVYDCCDCYDCYDCYKSYDSCMTFLRYDLYLYESLRS